MGFISDIFTGGKSSDASDATQQAMDAIKGIELPSIEDMTIQLKQLVQQGQISPEQAQAALVERSQMEDVKADPKLVNAQLSALKSLQDISDNGGMTLTDKANLQDISDTAMTQQKGAREAIIQNAAQRGVAGSGLELAAQLQNQQNSAVNQNKQDLDVAAQAQARALQAIQQSGTLAGNINNQQFEQESAKAAAQDAINKFNAQNTQQVNLTNTNAVNTAQAANLAEKQRIADANTQLNNQQETYNKNLKQQDFNNRVTKAGGVASTSNQAANLYNTQGQQNQKLIGDIGSAALTGYAMFSDENLKKDIKEFDAEDFLNELTGYKYKYKNPKLGKETNVGIMAQDVEKAGNPNNMVKNTAEGKMIDYDPKKASPVLFAALANLNDRLNKIEKGNK